MSGGRTSTGGCNDGAVSESRRALTVELAVEFNADAKGCPIAVGCDASAPVDHHVIDDTCYVSCASSEDGTAVRHRQTHVDGECVCRIVASHGCCPSLQAAADGGLIVRTNPADRATLRAMIEELRGVADAVRIRSLVVDDGETATRSELVSLQALTEIERETVERAILEGYYDRPRTVSFDDLATDMGITSSALSKRLASAEAKIMRSLFEDRD